MTKKLLNDNNGELKMKTLFREHHAISGHISEAELMIHPENGALVFCANFAQHGYKHLSFDSLSDMVVFLDKELVRQHYINADNEIHYLDGTIYMQYYASIRES